LCSFYLFPLFFIIVPHSVFALGETDLCAASEYKVEKGIVCKKNLFGGVFGSRRTALKMRTKKAALVGFE
jgi:hypothetical protein